jgi:hypothetical protein
MKHSNPKKALALGALALALGGCSKSHHHEDPGPAVFLEQERNDFVDEANYFGTLRPGDFFLIDGRITDDGSDPFDGFAFTANQPLHVDFRLFVDSPYADLDVCVYDPQIDLEVACYQTSSNPEVGGVAGLYGGLDCHLVVETYGERPSYTLAFADSPLNVRAPALSAGGSGLPASGAAAEARPEARAGAFRAYGRRAAERAAAAEAVVLRRAELFVVDEDGQWHRGEVVLYARPAEGRAD